jgi:hypothetical protein
MIAQVVEKSGTDLIKCYPYHSDYGKDWYEANTLTGFFHTGLSMSTGLKNNPDEKRKIQRVYRFLFS